MKATVVALLAAALLVAAASSERLPTFGEYLQQTPAGAASKAKTANADYPSVETEEVQFVATAVNDCRCLDGFWNSAPAGICPAIYAQVDLACASKKENYGYGDTIAAIPVATPVGRCDLSGASFPTKPILVSPGVYQVGTFSGTCKLAESVEDCAGRGPACGGMVANVQGGIYWNAEVYLKGMPATTAFSTPCKDVLDEGRRQTGTAGPTAGAAKAASYHDDDERPYGYDEATLYTATANVYHGTMTVVSAHKSAQAYKTVGKFQYVSVYPETVKQATEHPTGRAFVTKGSTFTFGFFKDEGKY